MIPPETVLNLSKAGSETHLGGRQPGPAPEAHARSARRLTRSSQLSSAGVAPASVGTLPDTAGFSPFWCFLVTSCNVLLTSSQNPDLTEAQTVKKPREETSDKTHEI